MLYYFNHRDYLNYKKILDCSSSRQSPLHTQSALKFYRQLSVDEGKSVSECSFILVWQNKPVIDFQGTYIENNGNTNLLAYIIPSISIEKKGKLTPKASRIFVKEFDKISEKVNGFITYCDFLIDGQLTTLSMHLLSKGAKVTTTFTRVIDLNKDEITLKSNLRKSYGSLVNWGLRELEPIILDSSNITWENICDFRKLHTQEAGRVTRSKESWLRQFDMVQAGDGFVVQGRLDNKVVSAGLFMHSKTNCYYGVSASRRDLFEKPMFHALMWVAITHAKKIGCRWFEVGDQLYPDQLSQKSPSKKELGISKFKAGFGGETICQLLLKLDLSNKG